MYKKGPPTKIHVPKAIQTDLRFCAVSGPQSFDPFARGDSTTGDYYSLTSGQMTSDMEYCTATECTEYITGASSNPTSKLLLLSFEDNASRPMASSTQRKPTSKRSINLDTIKEVTKGDVPKTIHGQALAEAITTAMSKVLEPLLAANEKKNKLVEYRGTRDGIIDGWMMLLKRYLEKAHAKNTPLDIA